MGGRARRQKCRSTAQRRRPRMGGGRRARARGGATSLRNALLARLALGARQRSRLGRLEVSDGRREGGECRHGGGERRVFGHPSHDALGVGEESRHAPRQGERDRRTTDGLGRAVHRSSPSSGRLGCQSVTGFWIRRPFCSQSVAATLNCLSSCRESRGLCSRSDRSFRPRVDHGSQSVFSCSTGVSSCSQRALSSSQSLSCSWRSVFVCWKLVSAHRQGVIHSLQRVDVCWQRVSSRWRSVSAHRTFLAACSPSLVPHGQRVTPDRQRVTAG